MYAMCVLCAVCVLCVLYVMHLLRVMSMFMRKNVYKVCLNVVSVFN